MKIINLIAGPRNLSTAIMYAFSQHSQIKVMDEPFYGYYLSHSETNVQHPESDKIIATMPNDEATVIDQVEALARLHDIVFIKGMAHHYLEENPSHILSWDSIILIRHPKKLLASFSKVIDNPTIEDIGIKKASEIFTYLKTQHRTPLVIDSDELLKNPENYLKKCCDHLNITFEPSMLRWPKGSIEEDGVWAPHWYKNVHNSTGFTVQKTSNQPMPSHLNPVLDEALTYYNILKNHILKND